MNAISRVAAAFLVSASMLAAAHAKCPPNPQTICGTCDTPCFDPYWAGMVSDSASGGDDPRASLSPATLVRVADARSDYSRKSKREALKPLNEALQKARFDARGRLVSGADEIRKAVESVREFTNDPLVGFIAPNVSSDARVNAQTQARIQTVNRLFAKVSEARITLY